MTQRKKLFREEAFKRRGQAEPINGLLRVTAPHEWLIVGVLGLAVLGLLAWSFFGRIDRSLSTNCILATPGERFVVVADSAGTVLDVLVDTGDQVSAGQPIAQVRTADLARRTALARAHLATLEVSDKPESEALETAHAALQQLEALQVSGEPIVSPYNGEIVAHWLTNGQPLEPGNNVALVSTNSDPGLEVLATVGPDEARQLKAAMSARVSVGQGEGAANLVFDAAVREVTPRGSVVPRWVTGFGLSIPTEGHLVRLNFSEVPPTTWADGTACRVRIVLHQDRPVQLLASLRAF